MVLGTGEPLDRQLIKLPPSSSSSSLLSPNSRESRVYTTDDGLIVPCIDADTRHRLFEQAYKRGFTKQRLIECMGRRYLRTGR